MKLIIKDRPFLTKQEWFRVLLITNVLILVLYSIALVCSLSGLPYFITNYHNERLQLIEQFLRSHRIYALMTTAFITFESYIVACFVRRKILHFTYPIALYLIIIGVAFLNLGLPLVVYTAIAMSSCLVIPIIDMAICDKKVSGKTYLFCLLRFAIAMIICLFYQILIYGLKSGVMRYVNGVDSLEMNFIYNLEYYIALIVGFLFANLLFEGKGDNERWMTSQPVGSFSQILKKKSQKLKLTKEQQKKIKRLYFKILLIQSVGFLVLMILPFLLGKVHEFLVLYFSFAITRFALGFKYSLHYNKESTCIFVGVVVFSILTLVIPFFYILVVSAIMIGVGLAILLHFSYIYRGMWTFMKVANKDRYAELFVIFNARTDSRYVKLMAYHYGVKDDFKRILLADYMQNCKLSYLAKKYNYSQRQINYILNEIIDTINAHI